MYASDRCLDLSFYNQVNKASDYDWNEIQRLSWADWGNNYAYPFVSRPNFYWRCSQLGLFPTTVNADSLFGNTIGQDVYFWACSEIFGTAYDYLKLKENIETLNRNYGGKYPQVENVIYTNGQLDVNFEFGITEANNYPNSTVISVPCKLIPMPMRVKVVLNNVCVCLQSMLNLLIYFQ